MRMPLNTRFMRFFFVYIRSSDLLFFHWSSIFISSAPFLRDFSAVLLCLVLLFMKLYSIILY